MPVFQFTVRSGLFLTFIRADADSEGPESLPDPDIRRILFAKSGLGPAGGYQITGRGHSGAHSHMSIDFDLFPELIDVYLAEQAKRDA